MTRARFLRIFILAVSLLLISNSYVFSKPTINLNIKTILASRSKTATDPRISSLTRQFQPVFNYSSYELLKQENLSINTNSTHRITLPGDMIMEIASQGITGNRISLKLKILRKNRQIFKTMIQLRNDSSVTIGGPEYKKGNLLFNIFASF